MYLIILSIFLWQAHFNFGYVIPDVKNNQETANIYELNDHNSTAIRIENNKNEPKLTEIVYYHIIEKPYDSAQQVVIEESEETDESNSDETTRSFTNSHGYQFLKSSETQERDENPNLEIEETQEVEIHEERNTVEKDEEKLQSQKSEETLSDKTAEEEIVTEIIYYDDEDDDVTEDIEDDTVEANVGANEQGTIEMILLAEEPSTNPEISTAEEKSNDINADIVEKKIQERNQLFNNLKNRYKKVVAHDHLVRRKRDINMQNIPEAPVLPDLDFSILPESIRAQIQEAMTEKHNMPETESHKPEEHSDDGNDEDEESTSIEKGEDSLENDSNTESEENLEKLFDKLFAELHLEDDNESVEEISKENYQGNEENGSNDEIDKHNEITEEHNYQVDDVANFEQGESIPRTYGMHINGDEGYVWNDLFSNPGVYFGVGENADKHEHVVVKPLTEAPETATKIRHPDSEDIHVNIPHPHKKPYSKLPEITNPMERDDGGLNPTKRIEKTHPKTKEDHNDDKSERRDHPDLKDVHIKVHRPHKRPAHMKPPKPTKHPKEEVESAETIDGKPPKTNKHHSDNDKTIKEEDIDARIGDTDDNDDGKMGGKYGSLEILMKDEKLWTWLAGWTEAYTDLLTKYIKKIVKEEILKNKHSPDQNKVNVSENKGDEISTNTEARNKSEEVSDIINKEENNTPDQETSKDNDEISRDTAKDPSIEDDKVIIDGKEIPITHTTNFKDEIETEDVGPKLKRRNDKDNTIIHSRPSKDDRKENKGGSSNIKAMNIYGNSMNNERVTNVYVFIKSLDTKGIEALKPIISGDSDKKKPINTLVIGNGDKVDVSTNTDSEIGETETDSAISETTSTKPIESDKSEATTELTSSTTSKDVTTEANIESKIPEITTERKEDKETPEPQENEDTKESTTEYKTDSTTLAPESNKNEEITPTDDKESTETKTEPTTKLPESQSPGEVESSTANTTKDEDSTNSIKQEETDKGVTETADIEENKENAESNNTRR